jgi:hypothetical protein
MSMFLIICGRICRRIDPGRRAPPDRGRTGWQPQGTGLGRLFLAGAHIAVDWLVPVCGQQQPEQGSGGVRIEYGRLGNGVIATPAPSYC